MSPKFRGDSEDWLDEEDVSEGKAAPKTRKAARAERSKPLAPAEANAVVAEVFQNQCKVRLLVNGHPEGDEFLSSYRRASVIRDGREDEADVRERSPVAVGDRVKVDRTGKTSGVIEGVCRRKNHLSRPAPGRENRQLQHVIAANVDDLVIVSSAHEPAFNPGLVDRYMVAAWAAGIQPILCLAKIDLVPADQTRPTQLYRDLGYEVFELSSKTGQGIEAVLHRIVGHAAVFCGQSGVGKTSLLRKLLGSEIGKIGDVSSATGKGKHTTTAAVLLGGPAHSGWIDTPGVREFGLADVAPERLASCFPEMRELVCGKTGCLHLNEPGCSAKTLTRYSSYRRILESLIAGEG